MDKAIPTALGVIGSRCANRRHKLNFQRSNTKLLLSFPTLLCVLLAQNYAFAQPATPDKPVDYNAQYTLGPDSQPQPGVPEGKATEFVLKESKTYPGFEHRWWLYVPAQYDGRKELPVMIFQDGTQFVARDGAAGRVPIVLNNLIAKKELPVMAAIFIDPGRSPDPMQYEKAPDGSPLITEISKINNRSEEYEKVNSRYADFVVNEILPLVRSKIKITDDPKGRAIGGSSSGANAALTAAWERHDQFSKVFSAIGSYLPTVRGDVGLPPRVAAVDRKPIRIFFQDGSHDSSSPLWGYGAARSQALLAVLNAKQYDYKFVFGEGTHNPAHEASILPDALRWLWRDYPR